MPQRLNVLGEAELLAELRGCCASEAWARAFVRRRPFDNADAVMAAADAAFDELNDEEWRESLVSSAQQGPGAGDEATCEAARIALRMYEERFGHPFVAVLATSAADELLMRIRIRLANDVETELRVTREEQRRLTRLRLQRLFSAAVEA